MADDEKSASRLPGHDSGKKEDARPPVEETPASVEDRRASGQSTAKEVPPPEDDTTPPAPAEDPPGLIQDDEGSVNSAPGATPGEPEPVKIEKQPVVPLGKATSKALLDRDLNPFILDKMFREGKMGRFATTGGTDNLKIGVGGSAQYEYHKWQLDHMYREVPEEMKAGLGIVRTKPDTLLYEEERFILGKMDRNLRESEGYAPIAAQPESMMDLHPNVQVPSKLPPEPTPCPLPYFGDEDGDCGRGKYGPSATASRANQRGPPEVVNMTCPGSILGKDGKMYQFSLGGRMQDGLPSTNGGGQGAPGQRSTRGSASSARGRGGSASGQTPAQAQDTCIAQCKRGQDYYSRSRGLAFWWRWIVLLALLVTPIRAELTDEDRNAIFLFIVRNVEDRDMPEKYFVTTADIVTLIQPYFRNSNQIQLAHEVERCMREIFEDFPEFRIENAREYANSIFRGMRMRDHIDFNDLPVSIARRIWNRIRGRSTISAALGAGANMALNGFANALPIDASVAPRIVQSCILSWCSNDNVNNNNEKI